MDLSYERLSTLYLTELSRLDAFAAEREREFALDSGREDPDVRRLIEAVAFFSARTRAAAMGAVEAAVRRVAGSTLDELLAPTPAAMMVQALPNEQLVEPVRLPAGFLLQVSTKDGRVGVFSTERALTVLPVELCEVRCSRGARSAEIAIRVTALRPLSTATTLSLYVRRLDDYRASLVLYDALERYLTHARAESEEVGELPCRVEFGPRASDQFGPEDEAGELGPFSAIRSFFQLPEQELFMRLSVPAVPGGWSDLTFYLELDEMFPEELGVSKENFLLGVVPTVNRWVDFAEPISCDGTRSVYPIRSGEGVLEAVELHELRGVYRGTDKGLSPLLPAALAREGEYYEFEPSGEGALRLEIADAFENPCTVQVEAAWSQPRLWSAPAGRLAIVPRAQYLPGVGFRSVGPLYPAHPSPLARDPARCLDVLALKVRPVLKRRDLVAMLEILGAGGNSAYRGLPASIDELESSQAADPERPNGGSRRVYRMAVRCKSDEEELVAHRLAREAGKVLDAWTEEVVDVHVVTRRPAPSRALLKESA